VTLFKLVKQNYLIRVRFKAVKRQLCLGIASYETDAGTYNVVYSGAMTVFSHIDDDRFLTRNSFRYYSGYFGLADAGRACKQECYRLFSGKQSLFVIPYHTKYLVDNIVLTLYV